METVKLGSTGLKVTPLCLKLGDEEITSLIEHYRPHRMLGHK